MFARMSARLLATCKREVKTRCLSRDRAAPEQPGVDDRRIDTAAKPCTAYPRCYEDHSRRRGANAGPTNQWKRVRRRTRQWPRRRTPGAAVKAHRAGTVKRERLQVMHGTSLQRLEFTCYDDTVADDAGCSGSFTRRNLRNAWKPAAQSLPKRSTVLSALQDPVVWQARRMPLESTRSAGVVQW